MAEMKRMGRAPVDAMDACASGVLTRTDYRLEAVACIGAPTQTRVARKVGKRKARRCVKISALPKVRIQAFKRTVGQEPASNYLTQAAITNDAITSTTPMVTITTHPGHFDVWPDPVGAATLAGTSPCRTRPVRVASRE